MRQKCDGHLTGENVFEIPTLQLPLLTLLKAVPQKEQHPLDAVSSSSSCSARRAEQDDTESCLLAIGSIKNKVTHAFAEGQRV